MVPTSDPVSSM